MPVKCPDVDVPAIAKRLNDATSTADAFREAHRWHSPPSRERDRKIEEQLTLLSEAMADARPVIGRLAWCPVPADEEALLKDASKHIQYARRQLKKMRT